MVSLRVSAWVWLLGAAVGVACASGDGERDPNAGMQTTPPAGEGQNPPGAPPSMPPGGGQTPPDTTPPSMPAGSSGPPPPPGELSPLGAGVMGGSGTSSDRYTNRAVTRDGGNYFFMSNGWGPGFESQTVSWDGTSFTVEEMQGAQGPNWEPASYPTVFCGVYSETSPECGLPAAIDSLTSLRTGWTWRANGNTGEYNAAYDVWLGNGPTRRDFSGYFMVWLRDPPGQQPAGAPSQHRGITVADVEGEWDIWVGEVNNAPIVNYVRPEGTDSESLEFDVLDFIADAEQRGVEVPGTHILSVAVGFEIWNGPVTNLQSVDFYVGIE